MTRLAPSRRRSQIEDVVLREAKREAAEAERTARLASEQAVTASRPGMSFSQSAGAAAKTAEFATASATAAQRAAFLLDLRLKLAESTSTYRPWQQIPAWVLGAAGIALAFVLAFSAETAYAGWTVAALMLALSVITSFRGPADLSIGSGPERSGDGGDKPDKPDKPKEPGGQAAETGADGGPGATAAAPAVPPPARPARPSGGRDRGLRFLATGLDYRARTPLFPAFGAEELVDRLHEHLAANADEVRRVTANTQYARSVRGERERMHLPDLGDPRAAGWTFLVSEDDPDLAAIVEALRPLAAHRGMRDAEQPLLYRGDTPWTDWLTETYQAMEPSERPYYVMVVGGPESVPYHFQALLDSTASVGRVAFDSVDDLRAYAEKVVRVETAPEPAAEPKALFFAPDGGPEDATCFSRRYLAEPLSKVAADMEVDVRFLAENEATKSNLAELLATTPYALVYTASHGIGAPNEPLDVQRQVNGAICCQATEQDSVYTAEDVPADDSPFLDGAAVFQFACYGYGTPADSDFMHWLGEPTFNAEADFVAALPKRLLARPRGPIAFIGHVDTAWLHGFDDPDNPLIVDPYHERLRPFSTAVSALLTVQPVGLALAELNKRYDVLNGVLAGELDRMGRRAPGLTPEVVARLADTFVFRSDAQNYAVLGDPGARVRLPQA